MEECLRKRIEIIRIRLHGHVERMREDRIQRKMGKIGILRRRP